MSEEYKDPNWFIFIKKNLKEVAIGATVIFFWLYIAKVMFLG